MVWSSDAKRDALRRQECDGKGSTRERRGRPKGGWLDDIREKGLSATENVRPSYCYVSHLKIYIYCHGNHLVCDDCVFRTIGMCCFICESFTWNEI